MSPTKDNRLLAWGVVVQEDIAELNDDVLENKRHFFSGFDMKSFAILVEDSFLSEDIWSQCS